MTGTSTSPVRPSAQTVAHPWWRVPLGLLAGGLLLLALLAPVDLAWTAALIEVGHDGFVDLTRRTLFEGALPGISDIPLVLLLVALYLYVQAQRRPGRHPRLAAWRPALGYLVVSALAAGLGAVHSLKWLMGRARPVEVLSWHRLDFSPWYGFGPHYIDQGIYRGSFPSGHTAAAFVLLGVAYVLMADPLATPRSRRWGWAVGAGALLLSAAAALGAGMAARHWVTDGVASVVLLWPLLHAIYFGLLRVPAQRRALAAGRTLPPWWELRLCGWGLAVLLCALAVALGARALLAQNPPSLSVLVPLGLAPLPYCWMRLRAVYATLSQVLDA